MRILVTLIFFLIAGIFSSTIADVGNGLQKGSHLDMFGFFNTTLEDIEEFDRELCGTHGGSTAYDDHTVSVDRFDRCIRSVNSEVSRAVRASFGSALGSRELAYFAEYCRRVPSVENCIKNLTDSMKICLDVKHHESADILYNIASELMKFICKDFSAATVIKSFNLVECARTNKLALSRCDNQTFVNYVRSTVPDGAAIGGLGVFHLLTPDHNKCIVLDEFKHCTINVLHNNCTSTSVDLASSLSDIIKRTTTCDRLLKSRASSARPVDIALITGVTVMSLRSFYT